MSLAQHQAVDGDCETEAKNLLSFCVQGPDDAEQLCDASTARHEQEGPACSAWPIGWQMEEPRVSLTPPVEHPQCS